MKSQKHGPNDNSVIAMSNAIIPTLSKLSLLESRLFQFCLAHYDSRGDKNPVFQASVSEINRFFGIKSHNAYALVREAMLRLSGRPLEYQVGSEYRIAHWFTDMTYFAGKGRFEFRLNPRVKPYFLVLKTFFTSFRLVATKKFKRESTFKLYVNLKQWENTGNWETDLDELRDRLGVTAKYPVYSGFRRYVIEPAIKEINEHSDITVKWTPTKRMRRVSGIVFRIRSKKALGPTEAREIHEANQLLKAAEEEEKRLGYPETRY